MTEKSIRDQLWDAADPTGSQRTLLEAAALVGRTPAWLQLMGQSLDASWAQLLTWVISDHSEKRDRSDVG